MEVHKPAWTPRSVVCCIGNLAAVLLPIHPKKIILYSQMVLRPRLWVVPEVEITMTIERLLEPDNNK